MYIIIDFYNKLLKQTCVVSLCYFITYTANHLFYRITVHQHTYFIIFLCNKKDKINTYYMAYLQG